MKCVKKDKHEYLTAFDLKYDKFYRCVTDDHKDEIFTVFRFNTCTKALRFINLSHNFLTDFDPNTGCNGIYNFSYMLFEEVDVELHYKVKE